MCCVETVRLSENILTLQGFLYTRICRSVQQSACEDLLFKPSQVFLHILQHISIRVLI
jgi:hypothetical protein